MGNGKLIGISVEPIWEESKKPTDDFGAIRISSVQDMTELTSHDAFGQQNGR